MKRHIIFILLIILSTIVIGKITNPLSVLQSTFLIQENLSNYDEFQLFKDYKQVNNNILQSTMYKTNTGMLSDKLGANLNVRYYEVDGTINDFLNLKIIKGRFIWPEDYDNKVNYIVIDEKCAIKFFLNSECIGEKIKLNNKEYLICGVYKEDNSMLGMLSRTYRDDSSLAFIPIEKPTSPKDEDDTSSQNQKAFGSYTILYKIRPGYGFILNKGMENYFTQNMGKEVILKNMDYEVRNNIQKVSALKFIIFLVIAIYILIWLYRDFNKVLKKIKKDLEKNYTMQMIKNNKFFFISKLFIYSFVLFVLIYFYDKLKFQIIIDPDIIPSRLIDLNEIQAKLLNYIVKMNTIPNYATKFEAMVKNGGNIINYLVLFIFTSFLFYFNMVIKYKASILNYVKGLLNKIISIDDIKSLFKRTPKSRRYRHD